MKWHKFSKCLPPQGEIVLVHVEGYTYMVGQLAGMSEEKPYELVIIPWDDGGYSISVKRCLAWALFKHRSPYEHE